MNLIRRDYALDFIYRGMFEIGINQADLAEYCNISTASVSRMLNPESANPQGLNPKLLRWVASRLSPNYWVYPRILEPCDFQYEKEYFYYIKDLVDLDRRNHPWIDPAPFPCMSMKKSCDSYPTLPVSNSDWL